MSARRVQEALSPPPLPFEKQREIERQIEIELLFEGFALVSRHFFFFFPAVSYCFNPLVRVFQGSFTIFICMCMFICNIFFFDECVYLQH